MTEITGAELDAILSGDPDELGVHLHLVERDPSAGYFLDRFQGRPPQSRL